MKRSAIALLLALVLSPAFPAAGAPVPFQDGQNEAIADLVDPQFEDTVDFDLPADTYFLNATMRVAAMPPGGNSSACPEGVRIDLDGTPLWQFNRTGFGPLGRQDRFSNGKKEVQLKFGPGGGANTMWIRLPKDATVRSAFLELDGLPPMKERELFNYTGTQGDRLGSSVSGAGDLNCDGFGDVIVGAPFLGAVEPEAGGAFLYLGGRDPDDVVDLLFGGTGASGHYGRGVSGAGDVNGDGYDDVVVLDSIGGDLAQVFLGGREPDRVADASLTGDYSDEVGYSVAMAGDVNADGFDDIIVGGETSYYNIAEAHIYYGGIKMNGTPDVTMGVGALDHFGYSVSGAGDLNNDGYDDVIVGAPHEDIGALEGEAYIFFGSTDMGQNPDVYLIGASAGDLFGQSVSGAGDLNDDGYDDVVVGAPYDDAGGVNAGRAFVYFGGLEMDNLPDATYTGAAAGDAFGVSVSGAGDFNNDGIGDLMVGASLNNAGGSDAGRSYIFFGGKNSDSIADVNLTGAAAGDRFGCSVSRIGDQNGDGYGDVAVGAYLNDAGGRDAGRVYVYSMNEPVIPGVLDVAVAVGPANAWSHPGFLNGAAVTGDLARALNDYLVSAPVSGSDFFGNRYVDIPLNVSAGSFGKLTVGGICIAYQYRTAVPDFSTALNAYLWAHQNATVDGDLTVPLRVRSQSAGEVMVLGLDLTPDLPPVLVRDIGDVEMDEDTLDTGLVDIHAFFRDDADSHIALNFSVVQATNSSIIGLFITGNRYLAVDASTGPANDNWTGTVEAVVACADRWGHKTESNRFTVAINNVNDPPVITSRPVKSAEPGLTYEYNVTAIDGDGDPVQFSLAKAPVDMTIESGRIRWIPGAMGSYEVTVAGNDASSAGLQSFEILVPNRPPRITSVPPQNCTAGTAYTYDMTAEDSNRDTLKFVLRTAPDAGSTVIAGGAPARLKRIWSPSPSIAVTLYS